MSAASTPHDQHESAQRERREGEGRERREREREKEERRGREREKGERGREKEERERERERREREGEREREPGHALMSCFIHSAQATSFSQLIHKPGGKVFLASKEGGLFTRKSPTQCAKT